MESWGLQVFRVVMFKSDINLFKAGSLYNEFVGQEPDHLQNNRNPTPASPFLSLAAGEISDAVNQVVVEPGRVSFELACPDRQSLGPWAWKLSDGIARANEALGRLSKVFPKLGNADRLAVHVNLLRNVGTNEEAISFFSEHVEMAHVNGGLDMVFQLNRRMKSSVTQEPLNRLLRFSTSAVQELRMAVVNGIPQPAEPSAPERYVASLLIDVNTLPGRRYSNATSWSLLEEMTAESLRIAEEGRPSALNGQNG